MRNQESKDVESESRAVSKDVESESKDVESESKVVGSESRCCVIKSLRLWSQGFVESESRDC